MKQSVLSRFFKPVNAPSKTDSSNVPSEEANSSSLKKEATTAATASSMTAAATTATMQVDNNIEKKKSVEKKQQPPKSQTAKSATTKTSKKQKTKKEVNPEPKRKRLRRLDSSSDSDDDPLTSSSSESLSNDTDEDYSQHDEESESSDSYSAEPDASNASDEDNGEGEISEEVEDYDQAKSSAKRKRNEKKEYKSKLDEFNDSTEFTHQDEVNCNKFSKKLETQKEDYMNWRSSGLDLDGIVKELLKGKPESQVVPKDVKFTPLERQVIDIKKQYPHCILVVECGYKYRFFGNDAEIAHNVLNLFQHVDHNFLTASFPVHRLNVHAKKLVRNGYSVAVVKQTEVAAIKNISATANKTFSREVEAVYTPATFVGSDADPLEIGAEDVTDCVPRYLLCFLETDQDGNTELFNNEQRVSVIGSPAKQEYRIESDHRQIEKEKSLCLSFVAAEFSTGEIIYDFLPAPSSQSLQNVIEVLKPEEILYSLPFTSKSVLKILRRISYNGVRIESIDEHLFDQQPCDEVFTSFFSEKDISVLNDIKPSVKRVLAATINKMKEYKLSETLRLTQNFTHFCEASCMYLPQTTIKNLEVVSNSKDGTERNTIFSNLAGCCRTTFGKRLVRKWLLYPLANVTKINNRLNAVEEILSDRKSTDGVLNNLQQTMTRLPDLERGIFRFTQKKCPPKETLLVLKGIEACINAIPTPSQADGKLRSPLLLQMLSDVSPQLSDLIKEFLSELNIKAIEADEKGDKIFNHPETDDEMKEYIENINHIKMQLDEHLQKLREKLSLPGLKYLHLAKEEYLIELPTKTHVPADWIRVNSTARTVRYRSVFVDSAKKKLDEQRAFLDIASGKAWTRFLKRVAEHYYEFKSAVRFLAEFDCLSALSRIAERQDYSKPHFNTDYQILNVENGRNIIYETLSGESQYIPSSINISTSPNSPSCLIVTGPNMGGKSSYLRQMASIVLLAQIGSFVPATKAELSVFDSIFTRMGASDCIEKGQSTFFVELSETSAMLRQLTASSLLVVDELGRGTSTYDGMAIAEAAVEHMIERNALTLFVTHYNYVAEELCRRFKQVSSVYMNYVEEKDEATNSVRVTFLYQPTSGIAPSSFGVNVARIAGIVRFIGIPKEIMDESVKASKKLEELTNEKIIRVKAKKLYQQLKQQQ